VDSLGSPVINVACLPISLTSSTASGFYGKWAKDVHAGQFIVLGDAFFVSK